MKKWLRLTLILIPLLSAFAFFGYKSIDVWFLEEAGPDSFALASPDCVEGEPCASYEWEPYCIYSEDEYGTYSDCYEYEGGEPLCIYADGPFWDSQGDPYFVAAWDYCAALEWEDPDAVTIPVIDYTVDSKVVGTVTTGALPFLGKFAISAISGKASTKRALKELKEELLNGND